MKLPVFVDPRYHDAVIFGIDGVAADTAETSADRVPVAESTVKLVRQLRAADIETAVVSSDADCSAVVRAADGSDLFAMCIDRSSVPDMADSEGRHLDVLHHVARSLGVAPARCVIVDDDVAGVTAGRDGGFGLVVGVDPAQDGVALLRAGADVVVGDLVEVTVRDGFQRLSATADALLSYSQIAPLADTRQPAVLLDFDGTISEIVNDPDAATLISGADEMLASPGRPLPGRGDQRPKPGRHPVAGRRARALVRRQSRIRAGGS
ncbi:HAD family hydrolase [Mycolicibacterium novocastrense]|nr:HAD family hydrolase [Mycolicibacterium novocastrense]